MRKDRFADGDEALLCKASKVLAPKGDKTSKGLGKTAFEEDFIK